MFENCKNSKKKGDAGLGAAIAYFTLAGIPVSIPLTDSQDYDLVIEYEGRLQKVQVKTSGRRSRYGKYTVELRVMGGNSKANFVHKKANELVYDQLFVLTGDGKTYLIPREEMSSLRSSINLGEKYERFQVVGLSGVEPEES